MMSGEHGSPGNRDVYLDPDTFYVCQRCTNCCKWPGDVRLEDDEIPRIAEFLGMKMDDFLERYTRLRTNRQGLSLIEKENHECIMLKKGGCRIHEVKPEQCAGFPNKWNFPGWQKECEAAPMPMEEARRAGLV
ncbi:YkgJ family cysteine cluster protein [Haloferula sp.]|uniref:YkgJ family cysteine cluster protein n=1 Tax=Haloferula sp. TaxID=2497595 RepID=UPI00329DA4FA